MLLMERYELAPRYNVGQQLVKCIRLDDFRVVAHECARDAVSLRELMVEFGGEVVFRSHLLPGKAENSGIPIPEKRSVRQWIKCLKISRHRRIYPHRSCRKHARARRCRGDGIDVRNTQ